MPIDPDRLVTGGAFAGPLARCALRPPAPLRELLAGERVGAFRVERELSRGGMGIVYLAVRDDGEFVQRVALKWMAGTRDRGVAEALFRRERDILASLEHPGIARLVDGGREAEGGLWFAMEFVEGEPIDAWCLRRAASVAERASLVEQLCEILAFAHRRLLIHRDIKPPNVLVDVGGRVRLLDFGIARLVDQRDLLGSRALTPTFASPEQWAGDEVTVASDVYQLGLLAASLFGVLDAGGGSGHATRTGADVGWSTEPVAVDPRRLRPLGRELAAIVARATALRPERRYGGVDALAADLVAWRQRRPVVAVEGGSLYEAGCRVRRHPLASLGLLAGTVALSALGWRLTVERDRAQDESLRAREAMGFIAEVLKWADPRENRGTEVTVERALARGVEQLQGAAAMRPEHAGEIALMLGEIYSGRRERDAARPLLEQAYVGLRENGGSDAAGLAKSAQLLGSVLGDAVDRERSIALLDEAIAACDGRADLVLTCAEARRVRAIRISSNGDVAAAIAELGAALALLDAGDPRHARHRLAILSTRQSTAADPGDADERVGQWREILASALLAYGPEHPEVSNARGSYINALIRADRFEEAASELEVDLQARIRLWGTTHTDFAKALNQRAFLAYRRGDLESAARDTGRAIRIARGDLARGRQYLASFHELRGIVERGRGNLERAADEFRRAVDPDIAAASLSLDHGRRQLALARTLLDLQRTDEAATAIAQAEARSVALPRSHARHASLMVLRARHAMLRGDEAGARGLIEDAMRRSREPGAQPMPEADRAELQSVFDRLSRASAAVPASTASR